MKRIRTVVHVLAMVHFSLVSKPAASSSLPSVLRFADGGEHTVGGGPSGRIAAVNGTTVHVLDGTKTTGSHATFLPDGTFVSTTSGLTVLDHSIMNIMGGEFTGGDGQVGGHGASVFESTVNIDGGVFLGGHVSQPIFFSRPGEGLRLIRSTATINDGRFVGDYAAVMARAQRAGEQSRLTINGGEFTGGEHALDLATGQYQIFGGTFSKSGVDDDVVIRLGSKVELDIYGGEINGEIEMNFGSLTFHGSDLSFSASRLGNIQQVTVAGVMDSGSQFSQVVRFLDDGNRSGPTITQTSSELSLVFGVPEPSAAALGGLALLFSGWLCCQRRHAVRTPS